MNNTQVNNEQVNNEQVDDEQVDDEQVNNEQVNNEHVNNEHVNPRPAGGAKGPPCGFSQIAPKVLGISLWNLPYLSGQQFHTLCQNIRTQVMIGQPWVTSEWRHVSPILTSKMGLRESPPLVQF